MLDIKYVAQFANKYFISSYSESSITENIENATLYDSEQEACYDLWLGQYMSKNDVTCKLKKVRITTTFEIIDK
ncbi:hypothetical protein [Lysinibacillus sp. NPDC086135]|uniref:hypothetical protein n=1 Tax=Lysinibacillus sp. NPDC086135 TaxID=3364130 RepID=UPI0037F982F1